MLMVRGGLGSYRAASLRLREKLYGLVTQLAEEWGCKVSGSTIITIIKIEDGGYVGGDRFGRVVSGDETCFI